MKKTLKRVFAVVMAMSLILAFNAIAMAHDAVNNVHDDNCYTVTKELTCDKTSELTCGKTEEMQETVLNCQKATDTNIVCGLEEGTTSVLTCDLEETPIVTKLDCNIEYDHGENCYTHNGNVKVHKPDTKHCTKHIHTDTCYVTEGHMHTDECYSETSHTHNDECYEEVTHSHDDNCYVTVGHTHVDACYTEHVHDENCYTITKTLNCNANNTLPNPGTGVLGGGTTTDDTPSVDSEGSEPPVPAEPEEDEITGDAPGSDALGAGSETIDSDAMGDPDAIEDDEEEDVDADALGTKTGDSTDMVPWAVGFGAALVLLGGAVALRRREN